MSSFGPDGTGSDAIFTAVCRHFYYIKNTGTLAGKKVPQCSTKMHATIKATDRKGSSRSKQEAT